LFSDLFSETEGEDYRRQLKIAAIPARMKIKLVALDIDGTLLDSQGQLPIENAKAIEEVLRRGVKIILVTGRRSGTALKVASSLNLNSPLIVHNGALIKAPHNSVRIRAQFIRPEIAMQILLRTENYREYLVLHRDKNANGQQVVHPSCRHNALMQRYLAHFPDGVLESQSLTEVLDEDLIQVMFGGHLPAVQEIEEHLVLSGLHHGVSLTKTYYPEKGLGIIDLLDKGCSKGVALRFLANYYGLMPGEILAIGDNHNDLEMLEFAGTGVIMGNSVEDLKNRGFQVTASNNENGVALALRQFVV
jgi:Cof subfamily protein (haloacid dehalogenase superfamily)